MTHISLYTDKLLQINWNLNDLLFHLQSCISGVNSVGFIASVCKVNIFWIFSNNHLFVLESMSSLPPQCGCKY